MRATGGTLPPVKGELYDVLREVPGRSRVSGPVLRAVAGVSLFTTQVRIAWRRPRLDRMSLPVDLTRAHWLGRSPDSDLVFAHPTVSWGHARLHHEPEGWVLSDLESSNGTKVNGWIVQRPVVIRPGDQVSFGALTFLVTR